MESMFSMTINYIDESGVWNGIWTSLKNQLGLQFISIRYLDHSVMKPLSALNISMQSVNVYQPDSMHFYIIKYTSSTKFQREKFLADMERYKNPIVIVVMDIDNSESSLKTSVKQFEKVKVELKYSEIKLLPLNPNLGKLNELVSVFTQDLKVKISHDIGTKIGHCITELEAIERVKNNNKENTFTYLNLKDTLILYLSVGEFWDEILKLLDEDLYQNLGYLGRPGHFVEPFSFIEFNEVYFRKKIVERTITNLEYQQYVLIQICRYCRSLRDYKRLNAYIQRAFVEISALRSSFNSNFLFTFWCYLLTLRVIPFLKSLRTNLYNNQEDEINVRGQLTVLNYMKKYLKSFANIAKIDIPGLKLFSLLFRTYDSIEDLENEIKSSLNSHESSALAYLESNEIYNSFRLDIKDIDERTKNIVLNRLRFYEEYYIVLTNIEKIQLQFGLSKLNTKTQFEKLPLILAVGNNKLNLVKLTILDMLKQVRDKWSYLYNALNTILLLVLYHSEKTHENLQLMFNLADKNIIGKQDVYKLLGLDNKKSLSTFVSDYINTQTSFKGNNYTLDVSWSLDIKTSINDRSNERIYLNKNSKTFTLALDIHNNSIIDFNAERIKIMIKYEDKADFIEIDKAVNLKSSESMVIKKEIDLRAFSTIGNNIDITFGDINIILTSGIECLYHVPKSNLVLILKDNNLILTTKILNQDLEHIQLYRASYYNKYAIMFYNTVYRLEIGLGGFDEIKVNKKNIKVKIFLTDEEGKIEIISNIRILDTNFSFNTAIDGDSITLGNEFKFYPDTTLIVNFVIEDTIFNKIKTNVIIIGVDVMDTNKDKLFTSIRDQHVLLIQHLFYLSQKFRLLGDTTKVLMQMNVNNNSDYKDIKILNCESQTHMLDTSQDSLNFTKILTSLDDGVSLYKQLEAIHFDYIFGGVKFKYCYPVHFSESELRSLLKLPYHIKVDTKVAKSYEVNQMVFVRINVTKYIKDDSYVMIRVKENDNWTIVGKSRQIECLRDVDRHEVVFKLIPLNDGYLKLPEFDFMEYRIVTEDAGFKNVNSLEFLPFPHNSVIEGYDRIVKVYSKRSMMLRLNII
jgi:hypothetical protein